MKDDGDWMPAEAVYYLMDECERKIEKFEKKRRGEYQGYDEQLELECNKLERGRKRLSADRRKLKEREKAIAEQEHKLGLTPTKRLKEAKELEAKIRVEKAKLETELKELACKRKAWKTDLKKLQAEADHELEILRVKLIAESDRKLATSKIKLTRKTEQVKERENSVDFEERRLRKLRHTLADREATVTAREEAIQKMEGVIATAAGMTQPSTINRRLEI